VRLFVALNLPPAVRQALWEATAPVRDRSAALRWARPEGIHLTLKFLGEAPDERAPALTAALGRAASGAHALTLALGGFGVFPDVGQPRIVWVGIAPDPALEILQHRVEQEFAPLGFPTEGRPFRPHATLGRAVRNASPQDFAGLEAALAELTFADTALVAAVDLMESTPQPGGAVYKVRHSERLP
jgi:2'-5' RNA ligase